MASIKELFVPFKEYKTYVRIVGQEYNKAPILMLHGGPGSTHNSFELLDDLADILKRPLIMYDQLGCGLSSIDVDPKLYRKEIWVEELINLREYLHLDKVHLFGHSWGGMLEIIYQCDYQPDGILSMILSSTLASASLWEKETHRLIIQMSEKEQKSIRFAEKRNNFSYKSFKKAEEHYLSMFVFAKPNDDDPECLRRVKAGGKIPYITAWGPCEFKPLGNLSNYEYLDKLHIIKSPTLVIHGEYDESTILQNEEIYNHLTCQKDYKMVPKARHRTYYENKDFYIKALEEFYKDKE